MWQRMPILPYQCENMRMNVSELILHELGLNIGCHYTPDKQEIKEISKVEGSMKCLMKSLTEEKLKPKKETDIKNENPLPNHKSDPENSDSDNLQNKRLETRLNFIPYPDHNYGQQPPLTPPAEPSSQEINQLNNKSDVTVKKSTIKIKEGNLEEQEGITTCICGFGHDDGFMISCDNCSSWQHIECMGIKSSKVPDKYLCHNCYPRDLDIEKAKLIQAKRREKMAEEATADDDEDDCIDETASEDENQAVNNKTVYTAISNTPTRITLFTNNQNNQTQTKTKRRNANRVTKRKVTTDQKPTKRKTKKKEKNESQGADDDVINDSNPLQKYLSEDKLYEEIDETKYDDQLPKINLPEVMPSIDFKKAVKRHQVSEVTGNRKGLLATCSIPSNSFILEYKGVLMSLKRFEEINPIFKQSCPYVVKYSKIEQLQLIIDARNHGNDARFIRRSCSPNADFEHVTINGSVRIVIISKRDILKDNEITVPFDYPIDSYKGYLECACKLDDCHVKKSRNSNSFDDKDIQNENSVPKSDNIIGEHVESESESLTGSDEYRHDGSKPSREERKLQAYMKQFEKLESNKNKKVKENKTPIIRTSTDENNAVTGPCPTTMGNCLSKPPSARKLTAKRRMSISGKRRTRQSSCSSEPVSPVDQDSNQSTPTTPSGNHPSTEGCQFMKAKQKKEKEPLTLTLTIQRKLKQEQNLSSPTPPSTPSLQLSPANIGMGGTNTSLSLSVDTQSHLLESTPIKTNIHSGLLQIAHQKHLLSPRTPITSFASVTSEETIGDLRNSIRQPISPACYGSSVQRRYCGSMKKFWLQKHQEKLSSSENSPRVHHSPITSSKQVSLAVLACKLSQDDHIKALANQDAFLFKKPRNVLPLKKRMLQTAIKNQHNATIKSEPSEKTHTDINSINIETNSANRLSNIDSITNSTSEKGVILATYIHKENLNETVKNESGYSHSEKSEKPLQNDLSEQCKKETTEPNLKNNMDILTSTLKRTLHEPNETEIVDNTSKRPRLNIDENNENITNTHDKKSEDFNVNNENSINNIPDNKSNIEKPNIQILDPNSEPNDLLTTKTTFISESSITAGNNVETISSALSHNTSIPQVTVIPVTIPSKIGSSVTPQASPRSSLDSNSDEPVVRKKLSIKEYRSRHRSQPPKVAVVTTSQNNTLISLTHTLQTQTSILLSDDHKTTTDNYTQESNKEIKCFRTTFSTSSSDMENYSTTPVSTYVNKLEKLNTDDSMKTQYNIDSLKETYLYDSNRLSNSSTSSIDKSSIEKNRRTHSISSENSGYEPVSPSDHDLENSNLDDASNYGHTIHTEITKNPFTIHNDITKNPFGKKTNLIQDKQSTPEPTVTSNNTTFIPMTSYDVTHERQRHETNYHFRQYSKEHLQPSQRDFQIQQTHPQPQYSSAQQYTTGPQFYSAFGQQYHHSSVSREERNPAFVTNSYTPHSNSISVARQHNNQHYSEQHRQGHRGYLPF